MIGAAIYGKLTSDSAVTALVGNRIYPDYIREADNLYPQIVYNIGQVSEEITYGGNSGLAYVEDAKIVVVSTSYTEADTIAKTVAASMDEGSGLWGPYTVLGCWMTDAEENHLIEETTEEILYYMKELTFDLSYYADYSVITSGRQFSNAFSNAFD